MKTSAQFHLFFILQLILFIHAAIVTCETDPPSTTIEYTEMKGDINEGDSCDDGVFCNGNDIYDAELNCVSVSPPCTGCSQICDEEYSDCVEMFVECKRINDLMIAEWNSETCQCEYRMKDDCLSTKL